VLNDLTLSSTDLIAFNISEIEQFLLPVESDFIERDFEYMILVEKKFPSIRQIGKTIYIGC